MARPASAAHEDATDAQLRRVLIAVILTQLLIVIDFFALNLALPPMAKDFGVAPTDLQFVISGYMIAIGALMIPAGRIADIVGRRKVTVAGVVLFGAASAVCGAAPNETVVVVFRIVEGAGAAMCFPVSIALVTATFPAERVQRSLGLVYAVAALGQALGPLVGGLLAEVNWRWVFFVNVPVAAAAAVLLLTAVRHDTRNASATRSSVRTNATRRSRPAPRTRTVRADPQPHSSALSTATVASTRPPDTSTAPTQSMRRLAVALRVS